MKNTKKKKFNVQPQIQLITGPHWMLIEERAIQHANMMIQTKSTIVQISSKTGWGKSTVHNDLTKTLPEISPRLYSRVRNILNTHKTENAARARASHSLKNKRR